MTKKDGCSGPTTLAGSSFNPWRRVETKGDNKRHVQTETERKSHSSTVACRTAMAITENKCCFHVMGCMMSVDTLPVPFKIASGLKDGAPHVNWFDGQLFVELVNLPALANVLSTYP